MSDETQVDSQAGATDEGQSTQSTEVSNKPNDANAFQADYTRKYQELADQRRAFEAEKQQWEQQRQQSYQQPVYQNVPQQQNNQTDQQYYDGLVEQFGYEGAQAIIQSNQQTSQTLQRQLQQTQFDVLYMREDAKGRAKYGAEWAKYDYTDPQTGQIRNKVMDTRLHINPFTNQPLSLESAWAAVNQANPEELREKLREEIYQEIGKKQSAQPATSNAQPKSSGTGHANSIAEAVAQARQELGID